MLDRAFYETPEYRSLLEDHKRRVVVGRRGTGKSALLYRLRRHWATADKTTVVTLTPSETEIIGLRPFVSLFGEKHSHLRAACSLAWQYAIINEILDQLRDNYRVRGDSGLRRLPEITQAWRRRGDSLTSRLFSALADKVDKAALVETRVATLRQSLALNDLMVAAQHAVNVSKHSLHILADRLDEGYEPDPTGIAILTGLVYAFDALSHSITNTATTAFLRDNIFRSIQIHDPDYSRNIEGDVLRLHWDEYHLFNMICNRLRVAFKIPQEKSLRVWETVTARDLVGIDGFRKCLRSTLYRPRDLLVLINKAFNHALSHSRETLVDEDIEASAHEISTSRLDDLKKEYREIIPGIDHLVAIFVAGKSELSRNDVADKMKSLPSVEELRPAEAQTLAIIRTPENLIHSLFSVGFLGVW
jgi:hypothetical protein